MECYLEAASVLTIYFYLFFLFLNVGNIESVLFPDYC